MTSNLATTPLDDSSQDEAPFDGLSSDTTPAVLFSNWPAPVPRPRFSGRELCGVLLVSALLHAGLAAAAYDADEAPPEKRLSRVEIELARPPERPKPLSPPVVPPPPKVVKPEARPVAAAPRAAAEPPPLVPVEEPPSDAGSSAPAAEDGELYAGNGGLGTAPSAPPAPVPQVAVAAPAPVVQAREGANYLKNPRPGYPRRAKREGWEGTTLLRVVVQASGKPGAVKVQQSSGHDLLDEAAVEAVTKWTFAPATRGGAAIAGSVTVPIVFRLQ
jgi:protein TonB